MAAFLLLVVLLASLALFTLLSSCFSAQRIFNEATKIGLPVVFTPMNRTIPWALIEPYVAPFIRRLPLGLGNWLEFCKSGAPFRADFHQRFGPAFFLVSPWNSMLLVADPEAIEEVFRRRKDFSKPERFYRTLRVFGANVLTENGEAWQRHRRITAPPFNERNSDLVWRESLAQAGEVITSWTKQKKTGVRTTWYDTMSLALNVLMSAGFGKSFSFNEEPNTHQAINESNRDTLRFVLENLAMTIFSSYISLPFFLLPAKIKATKNATVDFRHQMEELVEDERNMIHANGAVGDNLMSALLRSAESEETKGNSWNSLSDDEIFGNLFIYNVAGHDTSANTLAYTITLLSVHPEVQVWLREEIISVLGAETNTSKWDYEKAFPQLKRCLAVMYETLRLFPISPQLPRTTGSVPQSLTIDGKEYFLPPNTTVVVNITGTHVHPEYWGPDALTFRPQRFITSPGPSDPQQPLSATLSQEQHVIPRPGTFVPWISGPRFCPGKKFSQVEFVAVIASLFKKCIVSPVLEGGETVGEAKERVLREADNSEVKVTLRMREKQKVRFEWVEV